MKKQNKQLQNIVQFSNDQTIVHEIIQRVFSIKDSSFFNGKIGIAIVFFHYGTHTRNEIYLKIAKELLEDYLGEIKNNSNTYFESGLSGVGWAIEYLIQHNFIDKVDELLCTCNKIDKLVILTDPRRIDDLSIKTGLEGYLHYIIARIKGNKERMNDLPFDKLYLNELKNRLLAIDSCAISPNLRELMGYILNHNYFDYKPNVLTFVDIDKEREKDISQIKLGLNSGLGGILLSNCIKVK